jgi:hypothetical protein
MIKRRAFIAGAAVPPNIRLGALSDPPATGKVQPEHVL